LAARKWVCSRVTIASSFEMSGSRAWTLNVRAAMRHDPEAADGFVVDVLVVSGGKEI
jgi:hypothetical protein